MKTGKIAVDEVASWLLGQLSRVPENINAVYIEWNNSYLEPNTPREVIFASMATFGFEHLKKRTFDCANPDHVSELGDFVWEGGKDLFLNEAEYPKLNWTEILNQAAATPAVRTLVRRRDLLLLAGEHDDVVFDVS